MSRQRYQYGDFYPCSTPGKAKGGIKAQSKRGTFGENWWVQPSWHPVETPVDPH